MGSLPISFEIFFHIRAYGDKEVYPKSRLRNKTPILGADFRKTFLDS